MATFITNDKKKIIEEYKIFAQNYIAPYENLYSLDSFPLDLWSKMAEEKLIGLLIPKKYEGKGGDSLDLLLAGEVLMQYGKNFGFVMSWIIHEIISYFFIFKFGTDEQRNNYLKDIIKEKKICSLAISEPNVGAHPKHLKTTAIKNNQSFILSGEKTLITNGLVADIVIVIAITEKIKNINKYSAFIITKQNKGFNIIDKIELNFLKPSTHASIKLDNCIVDSDSILGPVGDAYQKMVLKFREIEDVFMMGPVIGAMKFQIEKIIENTSEIKNDETSFKIGHIISMVHALSIIAYEASKMIDSNDYHIEFTSLIICFRNLAKKIQEDIRDLIINVNIPTDNIMELINNDLFHVGKIALNVIKAKQKKLFSLSNIRY